MRFEYFHKFVILDEFYHGRPESIYRPSHGQKAFLRQTVLCKFCFVDVV